MMKPTVTVRLVGSSFVLQIMLLGDEIEGESSQLSSALRERVPSITIFYFFKNIYLLNNIIK